MALKFVYLHGYRIRPLLGHLNNHHPTHQDKKSRARWPPWTNGGGLGVYGFVGWILHGLICLP